MGQAHSFGFALAPKIFDIGCNIQLHTVADVTQISADNAASRYGFDCSTDNWRNLVASPHIDIVSITAPNALHKEMALAAIASGKHVYCEKPLAPLAEDARQMSAAAENKGV